MTNSYRTCILQYQEEERRIALVMQRKEEEKRKELNKMSVMKVSRKYMNLITAQPHYNAIFGVHRNRPCYK